MMGNWKINEDVIDNTAIYYLFKRYNNNEIEPFIDYNNERLTTIRHNVLRNCKTINSFYAPNVTCVAFGAFMDSSLTEYNLNSVIRVMDYAFYGCNNYHGDFENNLRFNEIEIGNYSFYHCNYIKNLYANYINIGNHAFILDSSQDEGLQNIFVENAYNFYNYAFFGQKNLKQVCNQNLDQINYIHRIGNYTFSRCTNLTNIYVNTINYINSYAFNGCTNLTIFNAININNIGANAFYNCNSLVQLSNITINTVNTNAFNQCNLTDLVNVELKNIKSNAFHGSLLTNLTNVSLQNIYSNAFDSLSTLKRAVINNLTSVTNSNIFNNCTNLSHIQIDSGTINTAPFQNIGNTELAVWLTNHTCVPIEAGAFKDSIKYFYAVTYTGVFPDAMFQECTTLNTVTISCASQVNAYMFDGCKNLIIASFNGPIQDYAFRNCNNLSILPSHTNVTSIGNYSFANGLTNSPTGVFSWPNATFVGNYAFSQVNYGTLTFEALTTVYTDTFSDFLGSNLSLPVLSQCPISMCDQLSNLKNVYINKCTSIEANAFNGCTNLISIKCNSGTSSLQSLLAHIKDNAFNGCTNLTTFIMNNRQVNIGVNSFRNCSNLNEFNGTVNFITDSNYQFYNCSNLTKIILNNNVTSIPNYCFWETRALTTIGTEDNVANLYNIIQVGNYSFYNGGITNLVFNNDNEVIINSNSFNNANIVTITWPKIAKMGVYVFRETKLRDVDVSNIRNINNSIYIPNYTFSLCGNLTNVFGLNHSVNSYAFYQCTSLTNVQGQIQNIYNHAFNGCTSLTIFDCPVSGTLNQYAFSGCTSLTDLKNIHYVYSNAFKNHPSLTNITNINDMGNASFYGCTSLTNLGNITQANTYAFKGCTSLTNTNMILVAKDYSFQGCSGLKNIYKKLTTIGDYAFNGCIFLKTANISNSLNSIGNYAFAGDSLLENVSIDNDSSYYTNNLSIGNYAFWGCNAMYISNGLKLTYLGEGAFCGCKSLCYRNTEFQRLIWLSTINMGVSSHAFDDCNIINFDIKGSQSNVYTFDEYSFALNNKVNLVSNSSSAGLFVFNSNAFYDCKEVKLSLNLRNDAFNSDAFRDCTNVQLIINVCYNSSGTSTYISPGTAFTNVSYTNVWLKVLNSQLENYRNAWKVFFNNTDSIVNAHIVNTTSNWSWE